MGKSAALRKRGESRLPMNFFSYSHGWRANLCRWLGGFIFIAALSARAFGQTGHEWRDGLSKSDVVSALGDPEGDVVNGNSERMLYKGGLLITLTGNQVANIEGPVPDSLKPKIAPPPPTVAPAPTPAITSKTTAAAPPPSPAMVQAAMTASTTPTMSPTTPSAPSGSTDTSASSGDKDSEKIINDFSATGLINPEMPGAKEISKLMGPGQNGAGTEAAAGTNALLKALTPAPADAGSPWSTAGTWQWFIAGLLIKTVIMTFVLKGAFAYKEFPVLWREAALVAAGVSLCNQILAWLFSLNDFGKIAAMVQADQIVAGAVLLGLIMNLTAAKEFPTAAKIMIAAMGANIAVGYAQLFFF
ncbi:MAG TPA: hypothetical protein VHC95_03420 [Opitutales bacterium]|nr:hypothetical protein [Opitutales bacterium]